MQNSTKSNDNLQFPIVDTVPNDLKTLIRIVMRTFYNFELYLCMEMLLIYPCMKEDDLAELLRLDQKVVHQHLVNLKKERFLNEKAIMETTQDGKQSKHSYFYINFNMVVNVCKYKLHKIRLQIECEENQLTTRANFKCTNCQKTYSDLDTKDIFLTMRCLYCGADVDEDTSTLPKQANRNLLNKFNTQMIILFELLKKVEHIRLAEFIMRPDPVDMSYILDRMNTTNTNSFNNTNNNQNNSNSSSNLNNQSKNQSQGLTGRSAMIKYDTKWSGDKTRNSADLFAQTKITINLDNNSSSNNPGQANQKEKKQLPSILLLNRIPEEEMNNSNRDSELLNSVKQAADETLLNQANSHQHQSKTTLTDTTNLTSSNSTNQFINSKINNSFLSNQQQMQQQQYNLNQAENLEKIIMDKLFKYEKKANTAGGEESVVSQAAPSAVSSITITKKRLNENSEQKQQNQQNLNEINHLKKRKLNNGDILGLDDCSSSKMKYHMANRSHSDGSENSDEYDEDYEYFEDSASQTHQHHHQQHSMDQNEDMYIPRVYVRNKPIRFDRITPKLINLMNDHEKDSYINICRQLYTEIYEI